MGRTLAVVVLMAGCGRWGFDTASPAAGPDASSDAATPTDATSLLACGAPARFSLGVSLSALAAVGLPGGFAMFTDDASGNLAGWAYAFDQGQLTATQQNVSLAMLTTGALGAAANGNTVLLASMDGMPTATGTTLYMLDPALAALATPSMRTGQLAATTPVATSGASGAFAFVTTDGTTGEVDGHAIASNGGDAGAPIKLVDGALRPANAAIASAPGGYVVAYVDASASPRQVTLELVDDSFTLIGGPVKVDNAQGSEYAPTVASSRGSLLVSWHAKDATNDDDVWIAMFDQNLTPTLAPTLVSTFSSDAVVAADPAGFSLAWVTYSPSPNHLGATHVAFDGTLAAHGVLSTGGTPGKWAMVPRATQPVLVWTEVGGTGPDLYFDPICAP